MLNHTDGQHGIQVILVRHNQGVGIALLDCQARDVQAVGVACEQPHTRISG